MSFARNKLFQTGQGTERVNDNLTDVAVTTEEQLAFRDITRIVGHGMRNVATGQSRHRNNRDNRRLGTAPPFRISSPSPNKEAGMESFEGIWSIRLDTMASASA